MKHGRTWWRSEACTIGSRSSCAVKLGRLPMPLWRTDCKKSTWSCFESSHSLRDLEWHLQQSEIDYQSTHSGASLRTVGSAEAHLHAQPVLHARLVPTESSQSVGRMDSSYGCGVSIRAIEEVVDSVVESWIREGKNIEILPGRGVPTEKPGSPPRKKYRAVICGNFQKRDPERDAQSYYAGGADSVSIRTVLRWAGMQGVSISVRDIRTAFLNVLAGVVPQKTKWRVKGALHGLVSSPRSWSVFKDGKMRAFEWFAMAKSENCSSACRTPTSGW